jgi:hypothetical protein
VANANSVAYIDVACNMAMHISREDFLIHCFSINLSSCVLILGINYLCTLGLVLWEFEGIHVLLMR